MSANKAKVQPLLELVEYDQHLLSRGDSLATAQLRERVLQAQVAGERGAAFAQPGEQPGFGLVSAGLDVHGEHPRCKARQQAGLDQRRLAATRWSVDQAHGECVVTVWVFDPCLPEADAVGQSVAVPRAWQQFQEKVWRAVP